MTEVVTVLGPLPADKLGVTLTHEHLILDLSRVTRDANGVLNEVPLAIQELGYFSRAGGASPWRAAGSPRWHTRSAAR